MLYLYKSEEEIWQFVDRQIPDYFREKYQLIYTVTFAALFSIVFLLLSLPFSHNSWMALGNSKFFAFTVLFAAGSLAFVWDQFPKTLGNALLYGVISLIIPYILAGMYFALQDKNQTIRLMNYGNVVLDENVLPSRLEKITLFDNSGNLKLVVSASSLYYLESDDNYIIVRYTDSRGDLKRYMIRSKMKTVEESFRGSSLVRCHRKYLVNMDKVKVLRKEKDGYELDLDNDTIPPIPVSKTYEGNVLASFNNSLLSRQPVK